MSHPRTPDPVHCRGGFILSWHVNTATHIRREALLDAHFLIKKAQALLRLANATDDPAIADRMRDLAAHCFSQAEQLSDDDLAPPDPVRPIRRTN
jgi:hypothetical protein